MRYLFLLLFVCLCNVSWGQTVDWARVEMPGAVTSDSSYIRAFSVDARSNLYVSLAQARSGFRTRLYRGSPDGRAWSEIYAGVDQVVATGGDLYLAHGCRGVRRPLASDEGGWETLYTIPPIAFYCLTARDFEVVGDSIMYLALGGASARRSLDGGATWELMNQMGYALVVNAGGTVFMGCMEGGHPAQVSQDEGGTWEALALADPEPLWQCTLNGVSARDVVFMGWYRSVDQGESWLRFGQELPLPSSWRHTARVGLSMLAFGERGAVFIGTGQGVWQSYDDGASWSQMGLADREVVGLEIDAAGYLYAVTSADELFRSVTAVPVGTEPVPEGDSSTLAGRNFPNPFTASTTVRLSVGQRGPGVLHLIDMQGRVVRTVALGQLGAGDHERSLRTDGLASGVYMMRLEVGGRSVAWPVAARR